MSRGRGKRNRPTGWRDARARGKQSATPSPVESAGEKTQALTHREQLEHDRKLLARALSGQDSLTVATGLLAGVYARQRTNELGRACVVHLAAKAFRLHVTAPGVIPAAEVLEYAEEARRQHPGAPHCHRILGHL
jgi:hypothetical protein